MAARFKRVDSWSETRQNVAKARKLAEDCGFADAHPSAYMPPPADKAEWDDLLKQIK